MKATWNGKVIAESNDIVEVEGNAYFPLSSIHRDPHHLSVERPGKLLCHRR